MDRIRIFNHRNSNLGHLAKVEDQESPCKKPNLSYVQSKSDADILCRTVTNARFFGFLTHYVVQRCLGMKSQIFAVESIGCEYFLDL